MTDKLFKYLESTKISWDRQGAGLWIAVSGYKTAEFYEVVQTLRREYKLKFDFDKGMEEFDSVCGKTFSYFKNVYKEEAV